MKLKRTFWFKKEKHWHEDGTYTIARDTALVAAAQKLAVVYHLRILAFNTNPYVDECMITIWGDRVAFNAFVADFCEDFDGYIESLRYS